MKNILQITPCLYTQDVAAAVRFFVDRLGFEAQMEDQNFAYVQRETAGLRILRDSQTPGEETPPGNRRFLYYIDVCDLDALLLDVVPRCAGLPAGSVFGPVDQRYGQREWMVVAPDGNLVVFGQSSPSETR